MVCGGWSVILIPAIMGGMGGSLTGSLSPAPPLVIGLLTAAGGFTGSYTAVWLVSRSFRDPPLSLRRSLAEFGVFVSIQFVPLVGALLIAACVAPRSPVDCALVGSAFVLAAALIHRGIGLFPGRWAGMIRAAEPRLAEVTARAATGMNVRMPVVEQADLRMANAFALPLAGRLVFTTRLLGILDDAELESIARHEIGHLKEPARVKAARFAPMLALSFLVFAPAFAARGETAVAALFVIAPLFVIAAIARLAQRWEQAADRHATSGHDSPVYAGALERIYEDNLAPAVLGASKTHPDLYARMVAAGITPSFQKPAPPNAWRARLSMALAMTLVTAPILIPLFMQGPRVPPGLCATISGPGCLTRLAESYYAAGRLDEGRRVYYAAMALQPLDRSGAEQVTIADADAGLCEPAQISLLELRRRPAGDARSRRWMSWIEYSVASCFAARDGRELAPHRDEEPYDGNEDEPIAGRRDPPWPAGERRVASLQ